MDKHPGGLHPDNVKVRSQTKYVNVKMAAVKAEWREQMDPTREIHVLVYTILMFGENSPSK